MGFQEVLKEQNLGNDFSQWQRDGTISHNLSYAVAEFMLKEGNLSMWRELNDNGDPSELISEFLDKEENDE